jgi:hypothetical protein
MTQPAPPVDPAKTRKTAEYKHSRPLTACYWEPKGRYLFFGAEDNLIHRYDVAAKTALPLAAHDSWVRAFAATPDGETLLSGGYDGRLVWWPATADKPAPQRVVDAHAGWVRALAVSPSGLRVATCGNDRLVKEWDIATGTLVRTLAGHASHVYNVCYGKDDGALYSCDHRGVVMAWTLPPVAAGGTPGANTPTANTPTANTPTANTPTANTPAATAPAGGVAGTAPGVEIAKVEALHFYDTTFRADIGGARSIALRGDGGRLALGGITNVSNAFAGVGEVAVAVVDPAARKLEILLIAKEKTQGAVWGVAHHPDGFWIGLSGGGGGWLLFWKGDTANEFFRFKLPADGRGLGVAPDHRQVAVAHADSHLRVYALHADA